MDADREGPTSLSQDRVKVQRYSKARFVRHRDDETYTGVARPYEQERVLVDKDSTETCSVYHATGDPVDVYSVESGGEVVAALTAGDSYVVTSRVWLESSGTSYVLVRKT